MNVVMIIVLMILTEKSHFGVKYFKVKTVILATVNSVRLL